MALKALNLKDYNFFEQVEDLVWEKDISYLDAICEWCMNHGVEVEQVASLIKKDPTSLARLKEEADKLNFLKKDQTERSEQIIL